MKLSNHDYCHRCAEKYIYLLHEIWDVQYEKGGRYIVEPFPTEEEFTERFHAEVRLAGVLETEEDKTLVSELKEILGNMHERVEKDRNRYIGADTEIRTIPPKEFEKTIMELGDAWWEKMAGLVE